MSLDPVLLLFLLSVLGVDFIEPVMKGSCVFIEILNTKKLCPFLIKVYVYLIVTEETLGHFLKYLMKLIYFFLLAYFLKGNKYGFFC